MRKSRTICYCRLDGSSAAVVGNSEGVHAPLLLNSAGLVQSTGVPGGVVMESAPFLDVSPEDPRWGHAFAPGSGGVRLHYVRQGRGPAVLLLHGWPGFWYDWRRLIPLLAPEADVIAPDFRGFGESDKPDLPAVEAYTPQVLAADLLALLDHLAIGDVVVAAHDIGATVAQTLARKIPARVRALALFNPPYPGIGRRRFDPMVQSELWYQHFHNMPWSDQLIGYNRDTVRLYLAHWYDHWVGRQATVRPKEFEAIVDTFARPGAIRGSIAFSRARAATRPQEATADPQALQIAQPVVVLWGERDPVMRAAWSDQLLSLRLLPDVGHFVPFEAPEEGLEAIRAAVAAGWR
jgi:pimeloyl-ACP methyl ester carboxylesterase